MSSSNPAVDAAINIQLATSYSIRSIAATLVASVWLVGGLVVSLALSIDERLRCAVSSCYSSNSSEGTQAVIAISGVVIFIIGVITAIVYSQKASTHRAAALKAAADSAPTAEASAASV
jgi:hypothetical protein